MNLARIEKSLQRDQQREDMIRREVERCFPSGGQRSPEHIDMVFVAECREFLLYKALFDEHANNGKPIRRELYAFVASSEVTLFEYETELLQAICAEVHKRRWASLVETLFQTHVVAGVLALMLCVVLGVGMLTGFQGEPPQALVQLAGIAFAFFFGTQASSSLRDRASRRDPG